MSAPIQLQKSTSTSGENPSEHSTNTEVSVEDKVNQVYANLVLLDIGVQKKWVPTLTQKRLANIFETQRKQSEFTEDHNIWYLASSRLLSKIRSDQERKLAELDQDARNLARNLESTLVEKKEEV